MTADALREPPPMTKPALPLRSLKVEDLSPADAAAEHAALAEEIKGHDAAYYREDAPVISDADYDALRRRYADIEEYTVATSEYTVWETIAPAAAACAYLTKPGVAVRNPNREPAKDIRDLPGYWMLP